MTSTYTPGTGPERATQDAAVAAHQFEQIMFATSRRIERAGRDHGHRLQKFWSDAADVQRRFAESRKVGKLADDAKAYAIDAQQRYTLALNVLRERDQQDIAHEEAGTPPVLIYDYEVVLDGKSLPRPTNKVLLKILPPEGVEVKDWKRPYMIVDPRAGHGAGIGGFKSDSQVGVALRDGHPVYFVVFRPHPEPGQTLADVMRSEAAFVARIRELHPDAPKPIIVGNCQGGWASLILAAMNPDISGPLVVNGAPVAYWSGRLGENPMRYNGGLLGGALPALFSSDLGNGEFDGTHLVSNFEMLNPGPQLFRQVLRPVRPTGEDAQELPRVRKVVGRLPLHERAGDPLDRREPVRRQQARAPRGEPRARPPDRPQSDPHADHRVRLLGRQHHPAAAGAQLDRRHLCRRARDQDTRPAHHLHGA